MKFLNNKIKKARKGKIQITNKSNLSKQTRTSVFNNKIYQHQSKGLSLKKKNLSKSWRKLIRLRLDQEVSRKLQTTILIEINIFKKDWQNLKRITKIMSQVQILMIVDPYLLPCQTLQFQNTFSRKERTQAQSSTHWTNKKS